MLKRIALALFLVIVTAMVSLHSDASLSSMIWGFPQLSYDHSITAFEKDTAFSSDNETASVSFPATASDLTSGIFGSSGISIFQNSEKITLMNSIKFQDETEHFEFSYPFMSIGNSWMPSFGFL